MAYCLEADIRKQSPFKDVLLITPAYVTQKIAEADNIINGAIGGTYTLPLNPVPDTIVNISKELTTLIIFQEQDKNIEVQPGINIQAEWKTLMDALNAIALRKLKLFDSNGIELPLNSSALPSGYPNNTSSDPSYPNSTAPRFTMGQKF